MDFETSSTFTPTLRLGQETQASRTGMMEGCRVSKGDGKESRPTHHHRQADHSSSYCQLLNLTKSPLLDPLRVGKNCYQSSEQCSESFCPLIALSHMICAEERCRSSWTDRALHRPIILSTRLARGHSGGGHSIESVSGIFKVS